MLFKLNLLLVDKQEPHAYLRRTRSSGKKKARHFAPLYDQHPNLYKSRYLQLYKSWWWWCSHSSRQSLQWFSFPPSFALRFLYGYVSSLNYSINVDCSELLFLKVKIKEESQRNCTWQAFMRGYTYACLRINCGCHKNWTRKIIAGWNLHSDIINPRHISLASNLKGYFMNFILNIW